MVLMDLKQFDGKKMLRHLSFSSTKCEQLLCPWGTWEDPESGSTGVKSAFLVYLCT